MNRVYSYFLKFSDAYFKKMMYDDGNRDERKDNQEEKTETEKDSDLILFYKNKLKIRIFTGESMEVLSLNETLHERFNDLGDNDTYLGWIFPSVIKKISYVPYLDKTSMLQFQYNGDIRDTFEEVFIHMMSFYRLEIKDVAFSNKVQIVFEPGTNELSSFLLNTRTRDKHYKYVTRILQCLKLFSFPVYEDAFYTFLTEDLQSYYIPENILRTWKDIYTRDIHSFALQVPDKLTLEEEMRRRKNKKKSSRSR
jgi:hypothetical protein